MLYLSKNTGVFMTKYIFKRCKSVVWVMLLVIILGVANAVLGNYMFKLIGFVIDYGLNFNGTPYKGELSFLFSGNFGDYGSLTLILSLCVAIIVCALISYLSILVSYHIQKREQNYIANKFRVEIFKKSAGKKLPISSGDMMVLLHEDIYEIGNTFISYYSAIISSIMSIVYTIFMLNTISPYLLIAPIALTPLLIYFSIKYHKATYVQNRAYRNADGELKDSINRLTATQDENEYKEFKAINKKHTEERKKISHVSNKYSTILNVIKVLIYIISCTIAGVLAIYGQILIGEYLIFTSFINTIYSQLITLINNIITIRSVQPRVENVKTLMEEHLNG